MDKQICEILDYWFAESAIQESAMNERMNFWFGKNDQTDREIKHLFFKDIDKLIAGEYQYWLDIPKGRLASIILIDQFCRQIYRAMPKAFEYDQIAREYCLTGIRIGHDLALSRPLRYFFYLPLEHSEDIGLQNQCVAAYQAMVDQAPKEHKQIYQGAVDYAQKHQLIIERFKRFPHRNQVLGRESTQQELEFLKMPGSSF